MSTPAPEPEEVTSPRNCALQLIKISGSGNSFSLSLCEDSFDYVLSQVPHGMEISVVSVVGALRSGKSFLLSFFVRFLKYRSDLDPSVSWVRTGGPFPHAINREDTDLPGFQSRGGHRPTTTGIWIWSEPFIEEKPGGGKMAVLLLDTQGVFDGTTPPCLATGIFSVSTLLSSCQIYNVEKRIQEDHLEHLALFSQYGQATYSKYQQDAAATVGGGWRAAVAKMFSRTNGDPTNRGESQRPFQRLEFLVRDYQNYEDMTRPAEELREEMKRYLDGFMSHEDIHMCFDAISCFALPYPGRAVDNDTFDGDVGMVNASFLRLLDVYVRHIFKEALEPKRVHGRHLTAPKFRSYASACVKLIQDGTQLPKVCSRLTVIARINCSNAKNAGLQTYKDNMDSQVGLFTSYMSPPAFMQLEQSSRMAALDSFNTIANSGNRDDISDSRRQLLEELNDIMARYEQLNTSKKSSKFLQAMSAFFARAATRFEHVPSKFLQDMSAFFAGVATRFEHVPSKFLQDMSPFFAGVATLFKHVWAITKGVAGFVTGTFEKAYYCVRLFFISNIVQYIVMALVAMFVMIQAFAKPNQRCEQREIEILP